MVPISVQYELSVAVMVNNEHLTSLDLNCVRGTAILGLLIRYI